ncbi:unnamed protein product [Brassicogethes aeneus]|uniref:EGF-like domain-containing protein n=1 Tax=Brassicogethes aeneus TaxID=1431903 RepID=A0A9P0FNQ0_BRAAE|nr:unnamed protein product [Brassicogethes aeneus]
MIKLLLRRFRVFLNEFAAFLQRFWDDIQVVGNNLLEENEAMLDFFMANRIHLLLIPVIVHTVIINLDVIIEQFWTTVFVIVVSGINVALIVALFQIHREYMSMAIFHLRMNNVQEQHLVFGLSTGCQWSENCLLWLKIKEKLQRVTNLNQLKISQYYKTLKENPQMYSKQADALVLYFLTSLFLFASSEKIKQPVPPCKSCRVYVDSIIKGMERTERGKFEGGDAAWEEEKLRPYATSELRLTEIQENLCQEVKEGKDQCYSLMEKYDSELEEWWFKKQQTHPDLFGYFCIDTMQVCCPDLHFGPECTPCPGHPAKVCNDNGKCRGAGTRKGNGTCNCHEGYTGELCDACDESYFAAYQDEHKLLCSKCHVACDGTCLKAGTKGCQKCKAGWLFDETKGCIDVNECASKTSPCSPLQFCVNNEGSYRCLECDRACLGCTGDGPDMCLRCASGFTMQNNMCIDSANERRMNYIWYTRYITYAGLCIATCIIFQKNTLVAGVIGMAVATYIYASEYMISKPPTPDTDALKEDLMRALN